MYKCNNCGCKFRQPRKVDLETYYGVYSTFGNSYGEMINLCPECEDNSITEYDEEEELARRLEEMKKARLRTLGMFVEPDLKKVTVLYLNDNVLNFVMERTNKDNKGYSLLVRDVKNNKLYDMHVCIDSKEIRTIQEMYINVLKHA